MGPPSQGRPLWPPVKLRDLEHGAGGLPMALLRIMEEKRGSLGDRRFALGRRMSGERREEPAQVDEERRGDEDRRSGEERRVAFDRRSSVKRLTRDHPIP